MRHHAVTNDRFNHPSGPLAIGEFTGAVTKLHNDERPIAALMINLRTAAQALLCQPCGIWRIAAQAGVV
jgi:hypothetical protein